MELIAYTRVSTRGQADDGYGLDVQEGAIRRWAEANRHVIVRLCSDAGVSGAKDAADRPGLSEALDLLRPPPKATGLVVARLDRLARRLHVQEVALGLAWRAGARVFTVDGGEVLEDDPDDPMRTTIRQVIGAFAELDRKLIAKRLKDGRRAKAAAGRHAVGDYAYGTRGAGTGRDRDAAPDEAEQQAVARIVALRSEGRSYRDIAGVLDGEGFKPRRAEHWSPMSVRNVATREGVA
jgi:DNA invertase Pin-like site-specific DNA recombinase